VTFDHDLDLDLENTPDAGLPGDHRVKFACEKKPFFVPAQKCPYHVTFDLDVAIRPFVCEKKRFAQKFTDGQTDDGRLAIALAHSWNELITEKRN